MTKEEGLMIKQQILNQLGGEIRVWVRFDVNIRFFSTYKLVKNDKILDILYNVYI